MKVEFNKALVLLLTIIFLLHSSNSGFARIIRIASDDFELIFARDYALQERLVEDGLFGEPITVDIGGESFRIKFSFVHRGVDFDTAKQVANILLASEERLVENGIISEAEAELIRRHREHFEVFALAVQRILNRNPWSIIARNQDEEIVGVVFSGLIWSERSETPGEPVGLPETSVAMTQATLADAHENTSRNTYADFWFTAVNYTIAEEVIYATFRTAQAIKALGDENFTVEYFYAYSNPRGYWKYADELSPQEYAEQVRKGTLRDPAIRFHFRHNANLALVIENAFPFITFRLPDGVVTGAIGNGYAFIMEYPPLVWNNP